MNRATSIVRLAILLALIALVVAALSSLFPTTVSAQPQAGGCPPGAPAIGHSITTATDITSYVDAQPLWRNVNAKATIDPGTVMYQIDAKSESVTTYLAGDTSGCDQGTAVAYVEFLAVKRYTFEFPGPGGLTATYQVGFEVFDTSTGNLLVAGGKSCQQSGLTPAVPGTKPELPCP